MTCTVIHNNIRSVLEETRSVYSMVVDSAGSSNMDYAGYCCHVALNRLKQELPHLSRDEWEGMLRRAARKHRSSQQNSRDWNSLAARYITRYANVNSGLN